MSVDEYRDGPRRLGKEEEESLVTRLYSNSLEQKRRTLEELDRRYYPVAEPQRISEEQLKKSVERQVDQEMALRRSRKEETEAAMQKRAHPTTNNRRASGDGAVLTMTEEEVDESVKRMYADTLARKKANLEESKRRFAPVQPTARRVPATELQEWTEKSSKPKKTEYTIAEVNKIYGLSHASGATA